MPRTTSPTATRIPRLITLCFLILVTGELSAADKPWQAGFAKVVITPTEPMFASGYGSRTKNSEGKIHDLYVRVAALQDPSGQRLVFVAMDLIGVPKTMADHITKSVIKKHKIPRANVMLCCSHTHCGPALDDKLSHFLPLTDKDWAAIRRNQKRLNANVLRAIDVAITDLKPAELAVGNGTTDFAVNRRVPIGKGPTDHDVPVLRIRSADGKTVRGIIYGYACHNTVLSFYKWCGDYAGFASLALEGRHENAVALFFSGCGADQNPLPRRKVELAEKYGRMLANAVNKVMAKKLPVVSESAKTAFQTVSLEFDTIPKTEYWERILKTGNRFQKARAQFLLEQIAKDGPLPKSYPYPVQVWNLGGQTTLVALGGEVVVDYSLRLKRESEKHNTWVAGYANDVMAYIPSERVLKEGGYEGGSSMLFYQLPTTWKTGLEERIVTTVRNLKSIVSIKSRK